MPRFRKKPVEIEARQFDGHNADELLEWVNADRSGPLVAYFIPRSDFADDGLLIPTLEGDHRADPGDWIIKGVAGEFYPCKPHIFDATYEPVAENTP